MLKSFYLSSVLLFLSFNLYAQCSANPTITGSTTGCISSYASYNTESGMTSYSWTITGGTIMGSANTPSITVFWNLTGPQSIQVNYTDATNCRPSVPTSKTITINAAPIPTISGNTSVCQGSSGNIYTTETGQTSYQWFISSGGTITSGAGTNSIIVTWNSSGNQVLYVTYVDSNGCSTPGSPSNPNPVYKQVNVSPLTASISGNSTACLNTSYSYTTESGKSSYNWSVVGGTIISGVGTNSITVNWNTLGAQNINVTYSDPSACIPTPSTNKNINVINKPVPIITGSSSTCQFSTGNTYTTEPGMSSYNWNIDFGGGAGPAGTITSGQGTNSISVVWNRSGAQSLNVNYNNNGNCSANSATVYNVNVTPVESPTIAGSSSLCQNSSEVYTTQSGKSGYNWTISAGGTITAGSGTNSITVLWNTIGTNTVSVYYIDVNSCTAPTTAKNVSVNARPIPTITGIAAFCDLTNVTYTTESGKSAYTWSVSSGGTISTGAGTNSVTVTWNTYGAKTISVNYTNPNGCDAITETIKNIAINTRPIPTITGASTICAPATGVIYSTESGKTGYTWTVPADGTVIAGAGTNSIILNWPTTGSKTVSVNYTDNNGCIAATSTIKNIIVNPSTLATITPSGPTTFCQGGTVTLTASSGASYLWSGGETQQSITVNSSGNYAVTVTNSSGCSSTSSSTSVTVNPNPAATITPNGATTFCQGGTVTLTASYGSSYLWSTGATSQSISASTSGSYSVTVSYPTGCSATSNTIAIVVNPNPTNIITASGPTSFCQGSTITLTASSGTSYLWSTGATSQSISVGASGSYSVTVTSSGGCSSTSAPISTVVNPVPSTPTIAGPSSSLLCGSTTLTSSAASSYQWSNGATTQTITVTLGGDYTVTTGANGCTATSAPFTLNDGRPKLRMTAGSTDFCGGSTATLQGPYGSSFLWSNGATTQSITISTSGSYSITVTNPYYESFLTAAENSNGRTEIALPPSCSGTHTSAMIIIAAKSCQNLSLMAATEEEEKQEYTLVYPNPSHEEAYIVIPKPALTREQIKVFDLHGKVIFESHFEKGEYSKTIYTRDIAEGMYLVRIGTGTNKKLMIVH